MPSEDGGLHDKVTDLVGVFSWDFGVRSDTRAVMT